MGTRVIVSVLVLSAIVLQVTNGQDLNGCDDTKGCFRQPTECTDKPGDECMAFVTWENTGDGQTRFAMKANWTSSLAWVALGLRPSDESHGMSPADVYACTSNSEVRRSENVLSPLNSLSRDIPTDTVSNMSVSFNDNVISCMFTRQASLVNDATFYDISGDNAYFVLLAFGTGINGDGSIENHRHVERWHTLQAMKLQSEFAMPTEPVPTEPTGDSGSPSEELDGCDKTKGCFEQPDECTGNNCMAYVTWQVLEDGQTRFAMMAKAQAWVAVGIQPSDETGMSPADVYACTRNNEVRRSENVGSPNLNSLSRDIPANTIMRESVTFEDNVISCVFERQPSLEGDDTFYNISGGNRYFVLLAVGDNIGNDGAIQGNRHTDRWRSSAAQDLAAFGPVTTGGQPLRKAHACLMVIAWVGFASIGIVMARFFKPMWPSSKLLGQKVWFTIHRMCMVTCVLCFCVAFVLIFVAVGRFVDTSSTVRVVHAVFGIIVTCLGIINPIMAIFRPHPGTPKRPIFNWAHWAVGTSAYNIALVTVFLGIGYQSSLLSGLPDYVFWIMIVFTGFNILLWILFEVQRCMTESQASLASPSVEPNAEPNPDEPGRSNDIPLKMSSESTQQLAAADTEPPADQSAPEGPRLSQVTQEGSTAKIILLCIYVTGVVITVGFLVIVFAIA